MANPFYGNIGDVWKHLALGAILTAERPRQYWESHAGSAGYPLTHAPNRDFGAFRFLAGAPTDPALRASAYFRVLAAHAAAAAPVYPGSPLLAMDVLGGPARRLLFCDLDGASLADIGARARAAGLAAGAVA